MTSATVTRVCRVCNHEKPLTKDFFPLSGVAGDEQRYFRALCRECYNAQCRVRDRGRHSQTLMCAWCKQPIHKRRSLYCSTPCRIIHTLGGLGKRYGRLVTVAIVSRPRGDRTYFVQCRCDCGKETLVASGNLIAGNVQSCGCLLEDHYERVRRGGAEHPGWKGGRRQMGNGYVTRYMPEHPNAFRSSGTNTRRTTVLEHVYVMSEYLGRPLRKGETVHHKNGQTTDNRIENLELWTTSHPGGQRVVDLVAYAKEILALYEPELPKLQAHVQE